MIAHAEFMTEQDHEQVVYVSDRTAGLRAVIAIHSTELGPSLGGVRFWHYPCENDAVVDVLRLSEAMTLKASLAGLPLGGGKAVVLLSEPSRTHPEPLLRALGRAVDELGGRYIAAEDIGATARDMDVLAEETPWVTGVDVARGGSGDPSEITAVGVIAAMRATLSAIDGDSSLRGRRVAVQGTGHVGANLVDRLLWAGANVVVADVDSQRAQDTARRTGVEPTSADSVLFESCDILAPCALGAVLNAETVPRLRARAVCGAANNQLADDSISVELEGRGILYAPDFVANAGGLINIAEEFGGYSRQRALARAQTIEMTMTTVFDRARSDGVTPHRAAVVMARERIAKEGAGRRWHPGDATAWTNGRPLNALR